MATSSSSAAKITSTATTSLRKTFKYPSEDMDSASDPAEMDEEEQESLITSLHDSNDTTNLFYARVFTGLPLVAMLPFLYHLLALHATRLTILPTVLALTSLLASAFTMAFVPLGEAPSGSGERAAGGGGGYGTAAGKGTLSDVAHAQAARRRAAHAAGGGQLGVQLPFAVPVDVQGPTGRWMQVLNGGIGVVLVVFAVLLMDNEAAGQAFWLLLLLPGVLCLVVALVRSAMAEAERGLRELGSLRYDYKGA